MQLIKNPSREKTSPLLPRGVTLRRGTHRDEQETFDVMRKTMGFEMQWSYHVSMRQHLRSSPNSSFWVAEESARPRQNRLVGYAHSVVRDKVWHLTEFFILPEFQGKKVGGVLLEKCLQDGEEAGADTRFVLASQNAGADSLYIKKAGCYPRLPMLLMTGSLAHLRCPRDCFNSIYDSINKPLPTMLPTKTYEKPLLYAEPFVQTEEIEKALMQLDREFLGFSRLPEHLHWMQTMGGKNGASRIFRYTPNGDIVGYGYLGNHASGPFLAKDSSDLPRIVAHLATISQTRNRSFLDVLFASTPDVYLSITGTNEVALKWLLQCGWRISYHYLFMSSRPLGKLENYICHNPLYTI